MTLSKIKAVGLAAVFLLVYGVLNSLQAQSLAHGNRYRILHIMSYHASWQWNIDQFDGFKHGLKDQKIDYRVFEMDTKRKSSKDWIESRAEEAIGIIGDWKPDLVYVNDDYAQEYVTRRFINTDLPFVFSGVNGNPFGYGIVGSKNVTGIIEQEHFIGTIHLLRAIVPNVRKIAVILDEGPTWAGVVSRMIDKVDDINGLTISGWYVIDTFSQYKKVIKQLHGKVDAVGLLGVFSFKDEKGENVSFKKVLRWTAENSRIPEFSFWKERVLYGTLCAVSVSGYEQGVQAGLMARRILVERQSPAEIQIKATAQGEPAVSLARARQLGIRIRSQVLLTADVINKFNWEQ